MSCLLCLYCLSASLCMFVFHFVVIFFFFFYFFFVFFFQAEDGIRDGHVTGVQTCALPICRAGGRSTTKGSPESIPPAAISFKSCMSRRPRGPIFGLFVRCGSDKLPGPCFDPSANSASRKRSEERRVGKECRERWSPWLQKE